jgi:hypothetical protein
MPSLANISSKAAVNLAPQSRMRKRHEQALHLHLPVQEGTASVMAKVKMICRQNPNLFTGGPAAPAQPAAAGLGLWVPTMSSPHATCEYSWIRPPRRSRRRTRMLSPAGATGIVPSGGCWLRVRCGRWVL